MSNETVNTPAWSRDELLAMSQNDDLHVSPLRDDGVTFGTPTWIWSVAVDGRMYVRPYNGRSSRWYQAALQQKVGRITAAGTTRDVTYVPVQGPINDRIDDAYRAKYSESPYLQPMVAAGPRDATVEIAPKETLNNG